MKSRIFLLAGLILSLADLNIQNCEKWSLTSEIMLSLTDTQSGLFTNILSIREAELPRNSRRFVNGRNEITAMKR